jgi:hypothetical protein
MTLGIEGYRLIPQIREVISRDSKRLGTDPIEYSDDNLARAVLLLDAQYEKDLEGLDRMEGVTLIRHETLLPDVHI